MKADSGAYWWYMLVLHLIEIISLPLIITYTCFILNKCLSQVVEMLNPELAIHAYLDFIPATFCILNHAKRDDCRSTFVHLARKRCTRNFGLSSNLIVFIICLLTR